MPECRSYPKLEAFEQLTIADGVVITADSWKKAHLYHRKRQNFQYQALYEPGIVCGLGVSIKPNRYAVQVSPGVAIDSAGNPIMLTETVDLELDLQGIPIGETRLMYIVINYYDPDDKRGQESGKWSREDVALRQKDVLEPQDVELCRIQLNTAIATLQIPQDVFVPGINQLDFRDRPTPKIHPQFYVQIQQVLPQQSAPTGWETLLRSLLYTQSLVQGEWLTPIAENDLDSIEQFDSQLLHIAYSSLSALTDSIYLKLQNHLNLGGVVLVVTDFLEQELLEHLELRQELKITVRQAERDSTLSDTLKESLRAELEKYEEEVRAKLAALETSIRKMGEALKLDMTASGEICATDQLRCQPFLFSQFPRCGPHPIMVKKWGGLVWIVGDITRVWELDAALDCPREVLRTAQEWGTNLLHFAAQRYQWMQALQPASTRKSISPLATIQQQAETSETETEA